MHGAGLTIKAIEGSEIMVIAFITGVLLGFVFFGGLYFSVNRIADMKHPAVFMLASMIVRMLIVLVGLYLIRGDSLYNIPLALLGIILARTYLTSWVKKKES
ncbi:ATP synthase subunit I [Gudongella sp. DL1XJH-153]|uniref:N-ATPase subunit AtpR n=1 Tax=Gudongella sp. DL1XJH-153 TaxID=3409804 RepID=UPI003BB7FFEE